MRKTVVVTGAGSGIGAETAKGFAMAGYAVFGVDLRFNETFSGVESLCADVSDSRALESHLRACIETTGRLDILVNNAGTRNQGDVVETSLDDWNRAVEVNLTSVFVGCKISIPQMLKQGAGVIVNVASMAGRHPMRRRAAYCATKAGVIGLTRQIALEYADRGLRANAICPGPTMTPFVQSALAGGGNATAVERAFCNRQPMGRLGEPHEIANAILFLASDNASYVNGAVIDVDGGSTLENPMGSPRVTLGEK